MSKTMNEIMQEVMSVQNSLGPGQAELVLDLCCRRCGEAFHLPVGNTSRAILASNLCSMQLKNLHECKDGSVGVADVLGFTDRSVKPVNTANISASHSSAPDCIDGIWFKVGVWLKRYYSGHTTNYRLTYLKGIDATKALICFLSEDGGRMFDAEELAAKNENGTVYIRLPDYYLEKLKP